MNLLAVPAMASGAPVVPSSSTTQDWRSAHASGNTPESLPSSDVAGGNAASEAPSGMAESAPHWKPLPALPRGGLVLRTDTARAPEAVGQGVHEVVVKPGDSLWSLTAAHLGPFATDPEIAAVWPLWHEANRDVIGEDPSLLFPGQVLRIPTP